MILLSFASCCWLFSLLPAIDAMMLIIFADWWLFSLLISDIIFAFATFSDYYYCWLFFRRLLMFLIFSDWCCLAAMLADYAMLLRLITRWFCYAIAMPLIHYFRHYFHLMPLFILMMLMSLFDDYCFWCRWYLFRCWYFFRFSCHSLIISLFIFTFLFSSDFLSFMPADGPCCLRHTYCYAMPLIFAIDAAISLFADADADSFQAASFSLWCWYFFVIFFIFCFSSFLSLFSLFHFLSD